jgi:hypothetical protein
VVASGRGIGPSLVASCRRDSNETSGPAARIGGIGALGLLDHSGTAEP